MSEENDEVKTIKIGDKEFVVPKNMADAIEAQQAINDQKINTLTERYQQDTQTLASRIENLQVKQPEYTPPAEPSSDDEDEFWSNPMGTIKKTQAELKRELKEELRQEIMRDQKQKETKTAFWSEFYKDNDDLKEYTLIVEAVLAKNAQEWANLTASQLKKTLADKSRAELLKIRPEPAKREEVVVEPGVNSVNFDFKEQRKPDEGSSLGSIIRKQNKVRREANAKFKQT